MDIKLYNTLSKSKKEFAPLDQKRVNLFVCGPTVYDYSHIGHARTYIAFDAFVKYVRHLGYDVRYIQNITDIDDKIIGRAKALMQTPRELARNFEAEYYHDMKKIGVDSIDVYARATNYIPQIISQVERLVKKEYAYVIESEGVYYDIARFTDYGKLSGRTVQDAEDAVSRIDESAHKRNKGDFALWKFSKPDEPKWPSPWGEGRPGWHIEDTAVTESELGEQYDIHGGARDLIFPHHESEIAQMEAISGKKPLVNFWMHTGFLTINGEKMSKSLGNFITIREFLQSYSKEVFRLFILSSHYRSPIDYSKNAVRQAEANVKRLTEFRDSIASLCIPLHPPDKAGFAKSAIDCFFSELADDFNTPKALAVLFEFIREGNGLIAENKLGADDVAQILKFLDSANSIFGIIPQTAVQKIPQKVLRLVKIREQFRKDEKWKESDEIRIEIEKQGFTLKDTIHGTEIKKA